MTFDWPKFCDEQHIGFVERGPSTAKGNVYIPCPFCGAADQGHHMGLSISSSAWGCWKNSGHRGRAPQRLIQALLKCSWADAARIAGKPAGGRPSGAEGLLERVQGLLGHAPPEPERAPLEFPKEIRKLGVQDHAAFIWEYMSAERDYTDTEITKLAKRFDLRYAMTGDWGYRLIIPVYDEHSRLATWSGRAISAAPHIRYKTLTADPEKAAHGQLALGPITDYLLGLPDLFHGGSFLILAEGQFDAFRLSLAGERYDAKASCLFGKVVSDAQLDLLAQLKPSYDAIFNMLDPDAALGSLAVRQQMSALGVINVPTKAYDPDGMTEQMLSVHLDEMDRRADEEWKLNR